MINLRCLYCQTPFTLGRVDMLTALITMDEKNQNHHDAHCPKCRRANSISRQRMELFFPNWREAAKQAASAPTSAAAASALKTEPLPRSAKSAVVKKTAASAKPSASKRQRASKPASAKKATPSAKVTTPKPAKTTKASPKTKKK